MEQTLKQRIIPEVDERETQRESEKVSSYVEEALNDIAPLDTDDPLFNIEEVLDDMQQMQEMTEEMVDQELFSAFSSNDTFAADVLFEQEPTEMGGGGSGGDDIIGELIEFVQDGAGRGGRRRPGDSLVDGMSDVGERLGVTAQASQRQTQLLGGMSRLFLTGAAAVAVGGFALSLLEGIFSGIKKFASASPLLGTAVDMIGFATQLFLRPIARAIGKWMMPLAISMVAMAAKFNSVWAEGGMWDAMDYLVGEIGIRNLLMGGAGLLAIRQIGVKAILSRLIPRGIGGRLIGMLGLRGFGGKLLARLGLKSLAGRLVGRLAGSLVPGLNAVLWGDLIFELIFGFSPIFDVLIPEIISGFKWLVDWITNLPDAVGSMSLPGMDDIVDFLQRMYATFTDFETLMYMFLGPLAIVAVPFFEWLKDKFRILLDFMEPLAQAFDEGGTKAVLQKVFQDSIPDFDVWDRVIDKWPGWPNLPSFDVWGWVKNKFPNWPDLSWPGWGSFIDNLSWTVSSFSWNEFIPEIDWSLPDFPGWGDLVDIATDGGGSSGGSTSPETSGGGGTSTGGGGNSHGHSGETWSSSNPNSSLRGDGDSSPDYVVPGLASGGIVTGPLNAVIGEGRESEVVAPLSKIDSMIKSRASGEIASSIGGSVGSSLSERDIERAVERGFNNADTQDDDVVSEIKRVVREVNRLRSDMDLTVEINDESKWEVKR